MTVTTAFQDEVYVKLNDASNSYTQGDMKTFEVNAQLDRLNGAPQQKWSEEGPQQNASEGGQPVRPVMGQPVRPMMGQPVQKASEGGQPEPTQRSARAAVDWPAACSVLVWSARDIFSVGPVPYINHIENP